MLLAPFYRYRSELEAELKEIVGQSALPPYTMLRYHLGWADEQGHPQEYLGGKLLRPTLCLLACQVLGGEWHMALPAAAAVELVHNFSLVHDDIEDKSEERRHRPTVWKIWGLSQGVNTGDALFVLAQLALLRLTQQGIPGEKVVLASCLLNQTCLRLCEGQYLDLSFESRIDIGIKEYLEMIDRKTAQLFSCSVHLGAVLATDNENTISHLCSFGKKLGLAYQMQDDLWGIWGEEKITGKSSHSDILERKKTLPIVYALEKTAGRERKKLLSIYRKKMVNEEDVISVVRILEELDAPGYTERMIDEYCVEAAYELEEAKITSEGQQEFLEVATSILGYGFPPSKRGRK